MRLIDPHVHMSARTTDDYQAMAQAGIVAVVEPAFWLGQPRTSVGSFIDAFATLVGWERFRALQFGIRHYAALGLNAKEANDEGLAAEVLAELPRFLEKAACVAVGEIGFDEGTAAEESAVHAQLDLATEHKLPVIVHTPHRDKTEGTRRLLAMLAEHRIDPAWSIVDHCTEETVEMVLASGRWAGFTIYPRTKMDSERMASIVQTFGSTRIIVNSSADWGMSDPLAVPRTAQIMQKRGVSVENIEAACYNNALAALSISGRLKESDWLASPAVDQRLCFQGNSVLRGQTPTVV